MAKQVAKQESVPQGSGEDEIIIIDEVAETPEQIEAARKKLAEMARDSEERDAKELAAAHAKIEQGAVGAEEQIDISGELEAEERKRERIEAIKKRIGRAKSDAAAEFAARLLPGRNSFGFRELDDIKNDLALWIKEPEGEVGRNIARFDRANLSRREKEEAYEILFGENIKGETLEEERIREEREYAEIEEERRRVADEDGYAEKVTRQKWGGRLSEEKIIEEAKRAREQARREISYIKDAQRELDERAREAREFDRRKAEEKRIEEEQAAEEARLRAEEAAEEKRKDSMFFGFGRVRRIFGRK